MGTISTTVAEVESTGDTLEAPRPEKVGLDDSGRLSRLGSARVARKGRVGSGNWEVSLADFEQAASSFFLD
jgi:hypothetical protein